MKIYIAGGLFNEAEVAQRKLEGQLLGEVFGDKVDIFNPIEQPFNEDKQTLPTPSDIFWGDTKAVEESDVVIADITNEDPGVMAELGIAFARNKKIIAINSDIRLKSASAYEIPSYSLNHYVLGLIENSGVLVFSFSEAIEEVKKSLEIKN